MKLRISGNSIRLRLLRSEVRKLANAEAIEERVELLPSPIAYRLASSDEATEASVSFLNGVLHVTLPSHVVAGWAGSETVGVEAEIAGVAGTRVRLLIEKDFRCLHGDDAGNADCYPNPRDEPALADAADES